MMNDELKSPLSEIDSAAGQHDKRGGSAFAKATAGQVRSRQLRENLLEEGGRTGRHTDRKIGDRKMGFLFIFLSPIFLSACPVPLRLCGAANLCISALRLFCLRLRLCRAASLAPFRGWFHFGC